MNFKNSLIKTLEINEIFLEMALLEQIELYYLILKKWNEKINITANTSVKDFIIENVLDPCLSYKFFLETNTMFGHFRLIDIGCGGGFTGMIWKILYGNEMDLVLLDSDRKKINFCKDVVRKLSMQNVSFANCRFSDWDGIMTHKDVVVSRATWNLENYLKEVDVYSYGKPGVIVSLEGSKFDSHKWNDEPSYITQKYTINPVGKNRYLVVKKMDL